MDNVPNVSRREGGKIPTTAVTNELADAIQGMLPRILLGQPKPTPAIAAVVGLFAVKVTKDGGSDGTVSTAATWTYTVVDLAGKQLGETVTVAHVRPKGKMTFGTSYGIAFYDGSTLILWDAGEYPGSGACP